MENFSIKDKASAEVVRGQNSGVRLRGFFHLTIHDKDGNLKHDETVQNAIVKEGLNYILDAGLNDAGSTHPWFIGLIDLINFSGFSQDDVMNSHGGWQEHTAYDETTRPAWGELLLIVRQLISISTHRVT